MDALMSLFLKLVNLSILAGWLVLAVLLLRILLRRAPKWITCLLWGLVALRLLCPFSLESDLSLIPSGEVVSQETLFSTRPEIHSGIEALDGAVNPALVSSLSPNVTGSADPIQIWVFLLAHVWALGVAAMLLYALVSYLLLRRKVATATLFSENIKESERVDSPFVLGLFRPVVYLPYGMAEEDREYVLAHERAHIRRRDHWWKPLGFLLLSVYWFHPLLWVAYVLLCRDIEAACDEKVIREMQQEGRRAYSAVLLRLSVHPRSIAGCPLAFGETDVKGRIKDIMHYKKPAFWVILAAAAAVVAAAVCLLTVPAGNAGAKTTEEMIARNVKLLLDAPDEYLESHSPLEGAGALGMGDYIAPSDNSFEEGYIAYLRSLYSTEECTERFCDGVFTYRCVNLIYPILSADDDFTVELEDIKVEFKLEESRIYSVEATAVLTLGGETRTLPVSTTVQLDEDGRISSVQYTDSMFAITDTVMRWVNSRL